MSHLLTSTKKLLLSFTITILSTLSFADEIPIEACKDNELPRFEDYKIKPEIIDKRASLKLDNEFSQMFRTRLRSGLRENPIELAGRFIVVTFGCGSSCLYGGFVDTKTGIATALPFALNTFFLFGDSEPLEHRSDSSLVIVRGTINESDEPPVEAYFNWTGKQLQPLCKKQLSNEPYSEK